MRRKRKGRPLASPEPRINLITIRLKDTELKCLSNLCNRYDQSVSDVIRDVLMIHSIIPESWFLPYINSWLSRREQSQAWIDCLQRWARDMFLEHTRKSQASCFIITSNRAKRNQHSVQWIGNHQDCGNADNGFKNANALVTCYEGCTVLQIAC